jgi:hypothetical protein
MIPFEWQKSRAWLEKKLLLKVRKGKTSHPYRSFMESMSGSLRCPNGRKSGLIRIYQAGCFRGRILNDISELNDAWMSPKFPEYFDFPFHFTFFDRFESLDNNVGIIGGGYACIYF